MNKMRGNPKETNMKNKKGVEIFAALERQPVLPLPSAYQSIFHRHRINTSPMSSYLYLEVLNSVLSLFQGSSMSML